MQTGADNLSRIQGQIERITFANEENGFTIAKLKTKGEKNLATGIKNLTFHLLLPQLRPAPASGLIPERHSAPTL